LEELTGKSRSRADDDTFVINDELTDLAELIEAARAALEAADAHLRRRRRRVYTKQLARQRAEP
jgi:hypothetical protein